MQTPPEIGFWKHAAGHRDALAVVEPDGTEVTFGELLDAANALVHGLRARGLSPGDSVAMMLPNSHEVLALFMAVAQAGFYLTPINWHLTAGEIAYILTDSGSKVLVAAARVGDTARAAAAEAGLTPSQCFAVGGAIDGFAPWSALTDGQPTRTPDGRRTGTTMTYTSGTTGRPKGVRRPLYDIAPEVVSTQQALFLSLFGMFPGQPGVHLCVAPLYHTAVINFASNHLHLGHTVVLMDKWTPEGMLDRISRYRVTNTHMVPTMFVRLLKLPDEVRAAADVSSLRHMIHGAAPCPVDVKRRMLEWWGPCIYEYYAASEGGGTLATPADWERKPGTVGKPWPISQIRILDDAGEPVPTGTPGTVWIRMGDHKFEYHGDAAKTSGAWREGFFTVGDAGYVDDEGYLFLCDRKADMIIVGGVNLYPAEIEAVLVGHSAVADVAVFGIPDDELGERVHAVVELQPGLVASEALGAEIVAWCDGKLARFKTPRAIEFIDVMPRDPNGKLYKRRLRDPHWAAHGGGPGGALPGRA
ncbi:MAG: acyl-CoA synthetase [Myxococcales bacterium]|nr:acyl-CoA synthetase [Myxococcales bacterium]